MKYIGLKINNATGHEAELESFIREYCIFERPDIPHNIAYKSKGVNIYSGAFRNFSVLEFTELVSGLPFEVTPIGYEPPYIALVSTVNFVLEFKFDGQLIRLLPTDFIIGVPTDTECEAISVLIKRGCLRAYGVQDAEGWTLNSFNLDFSLDFAIPYFGGL